MKLGIPDIFLLAGSINGFILSFAIFRARAKEGRAWGYLCVLVLVFSTGIVANAFTHLFWEESYLHKYSIKIIFLMTGPSVYFYVRAVVGYDVRKIILINLLPVLVALGFLALVVAGFIENQTQSIIQKTFHVVIGIQFVIYGFLSYRLLLSHSKTVAENYSAIEKVRLSWLRFLVGCFVLAVLLAGIIDLAEDFIEVYFRKVDKWDIYWIYVSCVIYAIGYKGLRQPEIWKEKDFENSVVRKKYQKTTIDPVKSEEYKKRLEKAMNENIYLDPDLSMPMLAETLGISAHHLSRIINETGMNFYDFINLRRVEFAKNAIETGEDPINIARIAFDAGFNSISAFNSVFKKFGKMTPSEWKMISRVRK